MTDTFLARGIPARVRSLWDRLSRELPLAQWRAYHLLSQRTEVRLPFWRRPLALGTGHAHRRVVILADDNPICQSQIYPFFFYRQQLWSRYGVEIREHNVNTFAERAERDVEPADIVMLQPWFTVGEEAIGRLVDAARRHYRPQRIVFLDSYAPTDMRFAKMLAEKVDIYVKKHVLRDRGRYGKSTRGESVMMDFYVRRYELDLPDVTFEVPRVLLDKLVVGPSFATADYMLRHFMKDKLDREPCQFDIHARMSSQGAEWYHRLRVEALAALEAIDNVTILTGTGVAREDYLRELRQTRLCFSPFGYGEIAWRDYEAVMCGSLLLKPDMSHVETVPNIFVPGETYVPIRWDFADLAEKVRYYLAHEDERLRIRDNAYEVLRDYFLAERFVDQVAPLFA